MFTAHTRRRRIGCGIVALAVVALTGCGSSEKSKADPTTTAPAGTTTTEAATTTSAKPATVDACALVTKAEAETLIGTALDPPNPVRDTCTYTGPVTGPTAQVEVFVGDGAKKFLDIDRDLEHTFTEPTGIGDEAYEEEYTIFVQKSGVWFSIRLVSLDEPATFSPRLQAAAKAAAERI